jgi:deoxyribose-phosphate aldolase
MTTSQLPKPLASYIDHTLLKPEATAEEVRKLCAEARAHGFATVCVNPWLVELARHELKGSTSLAICVVGFPLGANITASKAAEAAECIRRGAQELDMVVNLGALRAGDLALVTADIRAVVDAALGTPVKVILETAALTDDEKRRGAQAALEAGAAFVKTSTGFHAKGGATVADVKLLRSVVGTRLGVKASGGIRTRDDAMAMITAGADRIGASSSVAIVAGTTGASGSY